MAGVFIYCAYSELQLYLAPLRLWAPVPRPSSPRTHSDIFVRVAVLFRTLPTRAFIHKDDIPAVRYPGVCHDP